MEPGGETSNFSRVLPAAPGLTLASRPAVAPLSLMTLSISEQEIEAAATARTAVSTAMRRKNRLTGVSGHPP